MDQFKAMRTFVRVIDEGSFAGAARSLDVAPAMVTRIVAELEAHLGTRLINRTTRRIALTEIGEQYLERSRTILADVEEAEALASSAQREARGVVRLRVPPAFAVHRVVQVLPKFHERYPNVTVELNAFGPVDDIDDSQDITILWRRGPLDGEFVARRLARSEVVLCAAPEYLDRHGRPQHPRELVGHKSLIPPVSELQNGLTFYRGIWAEGEANHEAVSIVRPGPSPMVSLNTDVNYAGALAGLGITGLPSFIAGDALVERALERVLPEWQLFTLTLWACMPSRKHVPARTRVLLDFLVETFGGEDRDPWLEAAGCPTLDCEGAASAQRVGDLAAHA
ncbi:LysR family transcriptional regulator [Aquincola sp. MAHUQ-54]|uniref:LysR family transcriptional regulator n=1 Tax=Aquincola agrisoli TaxID=3119538 RepID=A0AAW9QJ46_9BURK